MYDLREDLFERDEEDSHLEDFRGALLNTVPAEISSKSATNLSYTTLSPSSVFDNVDDQIYFPSYDTDRKENRGNLVRSSSELLEFHPGTSKDIPGPEMFELNERPEDDIAACIQPSRHVDYLSHEWNEEEIWSSYKFIISKRKIIPNSDRLENASWRCWEKKRRNLNTVSCETVKWLKDHDVTWLYGPLQPYSHSGDRNSSSTTDFQDSEYGSQPVKPILKKLSLSQQMLQKSLSSASLKRESAGKTKTQHPRMDSVSSNNPSTSTPTAGMSRARTLAPGFEPGSRSNSPSQLLWNPKNVRFHDIVGQCIAVPNLGKDEVNKPSITEPDEDVVMMRQPAKPDLKKALPEKTVESSPLPQTISKLPDASLKCPESEIESDGQKGGIGLGIWRRPVLTPGASWRDESGHKASDDEDDENEEEDENWKPPKWLHNRKDSVQMFHDKLKLIRMQSDAEESDFSAPQRPTLERKVEAKKEELHVAKAPVLQNHDTVVVFDLPPCRSQLDSFSFGCEAKSYECTPLEEEMEFSPRSKDYFASMAPDFGDSDDALPILSLAKTAMVNRIMDEFWVVYNDMERRPSIDEQYCYASLPAAVRKRIENMVHNDDDLDEEAIIEDLMPIIYSSREQHQVTQSDQDHHFLPESPRFSSDSGYGSEETDKVQVVIKDINTALMEREKGVQDWKLYPDAWDELDEAVAWERGY